MRGDSHAGLTLHLALKGSWWQRRFSLGCHVLALLALWLSALPLWVVLTVSLGLAANAFRIWRKLPRPALAQILYRSDGWTLVGPGQQVWRGELLPSTWISRWLTLLHFRLDDGRFLAVPVWRDNLDGDGYRRLQVVLRWSCR